MWLQKKYFKFTTVLIYLHFDPKSQAGVNRKIFNFKARIVLLLKNSNDVNNVKRSLLPKKHLYRQTNKLIIHAKYFLYKKIYGCTTKGKEDIFQIVSCLKIVEKIVGRKQLLWFTDGVSLSIREQKKEVQLSLYCNFLRVKWKQKRFISLSEKCERSFID